MNQGSLLCIVLVCVAFGGLALGTPAPSSSSSCPPGFVPGEPKWCSPGEGGAGQCPDGFCYAVEQSGICCVANSAVAPSCPAGSSPDGSSVECFTNAGEGSNNKCQTACSFCSGSSDEPGICCVPDQPHCPKDTTTTPCDQRPASCDVTAPCPSGQKCCMSNGCGKRCLPATGALYCKENIVL